MQLLAEPEYEDIAKFIKTQIKGEYSKKIDQVMQEEQTKFIEKLKSRKDQVQIISVIDLKTEMAQFRKSFVTKKIPVLEMPKHNFKEL